MQNLSKLNFLFSWILINVIAWTFGIAVEYFVIPGIIGSIGQWMFLRGKIKNVGWWIPITSIGWIMGRYFGYHLNLPPLNGFYVTEFVAGTMGGVITGIGQYITLRNQIANPHRIFFATVLSWILGSLFATFIQSFIMDAFNIALDKVWAASIVSPQYIVLIWIIYGLTFGIIVGIISGLSLFFSRPLQIK